MTPTDYLTKDFDNINHNKMKGSSHKHPKTNTNSKNGKHKWVTVFLFIAIILGIYLAKNYIPGHQEHIPLLSHTDEQPTLPNIDIERRNGLIIYYPHYQTIDLICGKRPTPTDKNIIFCCSAAFTGELLKDFKHKNIAGNHVSNGKFYQGYPCKFNTGCFAFYKSNGLWTFAMNDYNKYVLQSVKHGGMAFGQNMVIFNKKIQKKLAQKPHTKNYYRVLAEYKDNLCIIESSHRTEFNTFVNALKKAGVRHALYLDMGRGWNHSFYRDNNNQVQYIHKKYTPYATNWIVFKR